MISAVHHPEPISVDGRSLDEITADVFGLMEEGFMREEIRLHAGQPVDWEDRWCPGRRYMGVLVV